MALDKRVEFLRTYIEREVSLIILAKYAKQMDGKPDEEKEALAERFTREIEATYPLREKSAE